jgi:predicted NAD/FAD-binding protein
MSYQHPVFSAGSIAMQHRHKEINGKHHSYFCGAYWGYGFHEDGVNSGLAVAKCFGKHL